MLLSAKYKILLHDNTWFAVSRLSSRSHFGWSYSAISRVSFG